MIEVFRNSSEYITHTVYFSGAPLEADNDEVQAILVNPETKEQWTLAPESLNLGRYQAKIPYAATKFNGSLTSYWRYTIDGEEVISEENVEVVTPYVSMDEITQAYPQLEGKTYEDLREMERRVRLIIDKITGQQFGTKRRSVTLNGDSGSYALDEKLYHVHYYTVNGVAGSLEDLRVMNDGWVVQVTFPPGYYHVKSDTYIMRREPKMTVVLHGSFGYPRVPNDINLAAKMLVGDYFCNDATYRQRGVQAVRAADWRLDFHDRAFSGTGNLDVDVLLSKYNAYNMVII